MQHKNMKNSNSSGGCILIKLDESVWGCITYQQKRVVL